MSHHCVDAHEDVGRIEMTERIFCCFMIFAILRDQSVHFTDQDIIDDVFYIDFLLGNIREYMRVFMFPKRHLKDDVIYHYI